MDTNGHEPFDAFAALGLERRLDLSDSEIERAWQQLSREAHPDSEGGDGDRSAAVNRARDILITPGNRLRHWLELHGAAIPRQSAIDGDLMALFAEVGETLRRADDLLKRRSVATSHLARAFLAEPEIAAQQGLQTMLSRLRDATAAIRERFAVFDAAAGNGASLAPAVAASARLGFLEKWESQCRERLLGFLTAG